MILGELDIQVLKGELKPRIAFMLISLKHCICVVNFRWPEGAEWQSGCSQQGQVWCPGRADEGPGYRLVQTGRQHVLRLRGTLFAHLYCTSTPSPLPQLFCNEVIGELKVGQSWSPVLVLWREWRCHCCKKHLDIIIYVSSNCIEYFCPNNPWLLMQSTPGTN